VEQQTDCSGGDHGWIQVGRQEKAAGISKFWGILMPPHEPCLAGAVNRESGTQSGQSVVAPAGKTA